MSRGRKILYVLLLLLPFATLQVDEFPSASGVTGDSATVLPGKSSFNLGTSESVVRQNYQKSLIPYRSVGDLLFTVTLTGKRDGVRIYIPPEFGDFTAPLPRGPYDTSNVWTSITASYSVIHISKARPYDPVAPLWIRLTIYPVDNWLPQLFEPELGKPVGKPTGIPAGTHIIKIFNVPSPIIVGRYFFKVFTAADSGGLGNTDFTSIGAANFPTVVVTGSGEPNFITGTLTDARTGQPIAAAARVLATGISKTGETIQGQAYSSASSGGQFTIFGLPDGSYQVSATAGGYLSSTVAGVNLGSAGSGGAGVSLSLFPGGRLTLNIISKDFTTGAPIPWGASKPVWVQLLSPGGGVLTIMNAGNTAPTLTTHSFSFNTAGLDGHVPQDLADYVSGLAGGTQLLRAHVNNYVQAIEAQASLPQGSLGGGEASIQLDLTRSGTFDVTVRFRKFPTDLIESATTVDRFLVLEAVDKVGQVRGWALTFVPAGTKRIIVPITGLEGLFPIFRDLPFVDYGLPLGAYTFRAHMTGFVSPSPSPSTIGGSGTTSVTVDLVLGAALTINVVSKSGGSLTQSITWQRPGAPVTLTVSATGAVLGIARAQQPTTGSLLTLGFQGVNYFDLTGTTAFYRFGRVDTSLLTGDYLLRVDTHGYTQTRETQIRLSSGSSATIQVDLALDPTITVVTTLTAQGLFTSIMPSFPIRLRAEAIDSSGHLSGAASEPLPAGTTSRSVSLIGFNQYGGDSFQRRANFFDTTNGVPQPDGGLPPGTYTVRVAAPSFTEGFAPVQLTEGGAATVNVVLQKLGRLSGRVVGLRLFGAATDTLPLSWASVAVGPASNPNLVTYALDGDYEIWLPAGVYTVVFSHPNYQEVAKTVVISPGSDTGLDQALLQKGLPPPAPIETPTATTTTSTATSPTQTSVTTTSQSATTSQPSPALQPGRADLELTLILTFVLILLSGIGIAVYFLRRSL